MQEQCCNKPEEVHFMVKHYLEHRYKRGYDDGQSIDNEIDDLYFPSKRSKIQVCPIFLNLMISRSRISDRGTIRLSSFYRLTGTFSRYAFSISQNILPRQHR